MEINLAKVLEEELHKELPYIPIVVVDAEDLETVLTAVIGSRHYTASIYQLLHEGVNVCAKALASLYKNDVKLKTETEGSVPC